MDQAVWDETTVKYESGNPGCSGMKDDQNLYGYCDSHLNFSAANNSEDDEYSYGKKKLSRDPLSHRIIEKRRRDRMNNCLADLSRLIPQDYMKKGRGRVEKTEIIEMAIRHMKHLMSHSSPDNSCCKREDSSPPPPVDAESLSKSYRLGYHDCLSEALHFLVDSEGYLASGSLCTQLATHLTHHCDSLINGEGLRVELCRLKEETSPGGYGSSRSSGGGCGPGSQESGSESSCLTHLSTPNNVSQYTNLRIDQWRDHPLNKVSPTSSGSDKCSSVESKCSIESGYKFKHTIQRRFESSIPANGGGAANGCSSLVPAFALSPRGHYYLPICLDPSLLPRDQTASCPDPPEVVLHPVTISVNFRPPQPAPITAPSLPVKQPEWSSY